MIQQNNMSVDDYIYIYRERERERVEQKQLGSELYYTYIYNNNNNIKESKKIDKYLDLVRELKNCGT